MVQISGLRKDYGNFVALKDTDLTVPVGEFLTLLGPSGSGKTTLLNLIAGMTSPSRGKIVINGRDVTDLPPEKRDIGMVFQNYTLMPHMTVFENIAFPLQIRKVPRAEIKKRVTEVLELVRLPHVAGRKPKELSGGQQQRISIARCIVYKPDLILMDEPLGALDKKLREQMQLEIRRIHSELGITMLYVTHDQEEAFGVADRVVILRGGRIVADGTPRELWSRPPDAFVASFLGFRNVAEAEVHHGTASTPWGEMPLPGVADGRWCLVLRPDALALGEGAGLAGSVEARRFRGDHVRLVLSMDAGAPLELEVRDDRLPEVADRVSVSVDPARVNVLPVV